MEKVFESFCPNMIMVCFHLLWKWECNSNIYFLFYNKYQ